MGTAYSAFYKNVDNLKRMMEETKTTDFPIFNDETGDSIRRQVSEACAERMENLMNDMGRWNELLHSGFKGYNDMSDLELILDYMEARPEFDDDEWWFEKSLHVTLDKEVSDKIASMIEAAKWWGL